MKFRQLLIWCLYFLCVTTNAQKLLEKEYILINENGIYVEKFDVGNRNETRFTDNNSIYTAGRVFTYSYYYIDLAGKKWLIKDNVSTGWEFVDFNKGKDAIHKVTMTVLSGLGALKKYNDYSQSVISFSYPSKYRLQQISSQTGLIENEKNVWMHPPRDLLFKILELNPFPFIQRPYKIGNTWEWILSGIVESWGDKRWKTWKGTIQTKCIYIITGHKQTKISLGNVLCWEITSVGKSSLGTTKLVSYFNEQLGFVKMEYVNIDGSQLVLELN